MSEMFKPMSRRAIVAVGGLSLTGLLGPRSIAHADPVHPLDRGRVEARQVNFDPISDPGTEAAQKPADPPLPMAEKVGFAIVGLGRLTMEEILPAFGESRRAKIAGLVSGSPEKLRSVGAQHGVGAHALYSYEDFDRIAENPDIKAVYIVLPNALHYEFVLRAAKAGKHVLCEKPMAVSSSEALGMINACAAAKVRLMIAYRCQYEPANRRLAQMMREREFGPLKLVEAVNAQNEGDPAQWRLRKALAGGGALPDIGLYCLNTIRALTGEEPSEIEAQMWSTPNDPRFSEVEESVTWLMRFPSGIHATCATHYGVHKAQTLFGTYAFSGSSPRKRIRLSRAKAADFERSGWR